jgi:transcriptional regulator with XRE-family HTH domain
MILGTEETTVFGRRLRNAREARRWTRPMLSRRTGIPVDTIKQYEYGRSLPSAPRLVMLAQALGVDAGWLVPVEREGET